jgi:hypothetical protein
MEKWRFGRQLDLARDGSDGKRCSTPVSSPSSLPQEVDDGTGELAAHADVFALGVVVAWVLGWSDQFNRLCWGFFCSSPLHHAADVGHGHTGGRAVEGMFRYEILLDIAAQLGLTGSNAFLEAVAARELEIPPFPGPNVLADHLQRHALVAILLVSL